MRERLGNSSKRSTATVEKLEEMDGLVTPGGSDNDGEPLETALLVACINSSRSDRTTESE